MGKSSNLPIWQLELKLCVTSPYAFKLLFFPSFSTFGKKKKSFISTHPTSTSHRDVSVMSVEYERLKTNCRSNPFTPLWLEENTTSRVIISTQKMINMAKKFVRKTFSEGCFWRVYASFLKPHDLSVVLRIFCIVWLSRKIFLPSYFFYFLFFRHFFLFIFSIYDLPSDTRMKGEGATFYICCSFLFFRRLFSGATRFKILIIFYYYDCTAVIFAQRLFFSLQLSRF